jgi:antitoxin (DNA-binding transcriptional repressor) of toxin-antitoxin stability system
LNETLGLLKCGSDPRKGAKMGDFHHLEPKAGWKWGIFGIYCWRHGGSVFALGYAMTRSRRQNTEWGQRDGVMRLQILLLTINHKYVKYDYHSIHGDEEMEKRISATRTVRDFSDILNTIKFKGARYIIERSGKPVASMVPIDEKTNLRTVGELKALLKRLPRLDEELDAFAADLEDISKDQPLMGMGDLWE